VGDNNDVYEAPPEFEAVDAETSFPILGPPAQPRERFPEAAVRERISAAAAALPEIRVKTKQSERRRRSRRGGSKGEE